MDWNKPKAATPAFPTNGGLYINDREPRLDRIIKMNDGMTLRDWFAGQALNGILAATARRVPSVDAPALRRLKAEDAYALADAMLAVRDEEQGQ